MSSDIQSILEPLVLNNYLSLVVITAVVYDYVLTIPREIDYVWRRPWTWVSTLFVVARYIGLYWIVTSSLLGTSFIPGPVEVPRFTRAYSVKTGRGHFKGTVTYLSYAWAFTVFLSSADFLMILRVYAMWNRSRAILWILLLVYIAQTIITIVFQGIYDNPKTYLSVILFQVFDFSFCFGSHGDAPPLYSVHYLATRLVLSAMLTIFAVFQTMRQSIEMYKATKQWQPNRYMQLLVKDGILYFIVNVLYQIIDLLNVLGLTASIGFMFPYAFVYIGFYTLVPRFVIGIRELYDRDIRGRFHIDTGFGVESRLNASSGPAVSGIVFVDGNDPEVVGGTQTATDPEMGHGAQGSGLNVNEDRLAGGSGE